MKTRTQIDVLEDMLKEEKKQTAIFGRMAKAINSWKGMDRHYHKKTLKKLKG
jgi:hypothetical protein